MRTVTKMLFSDVPEVARIEKQLFSKPWSEQGILDALNNPNTLYLVEREEKELIGYIGIWRSFEEGEITNVAVKKEAQNKGAGTLLLKEALYWAEQLGITAMTLEVRISNKKAIHLYEKMGFEKAGIRPGFYEKPIEDACIMWYRKEKEHR